MDNYGLIEYMVSALIIGSFMLLIVGLILAHGMVHVLRIPRAHIMAAVIALAAMLTPRSCSSMTCG